MYLLTKTRERVWPIVARRVDHQRQRCFPFLLATVCQVRQSLLD